jgi:hypothetical protein
VPVQFTTTPGHGDDAKPAAPGWARLAGAGLQHGEPSAKTLQVAIGAVPTTTGLHLLVDSTGIKMLGEGEWKTKKHDAVPPPVAQGASRDRCVHARIRSMEVTDNGIGDAPVLPALLGQIPADEKIASVSGDGAYDTKDCHEAIALRAAHAIIPTRRTPSPGRQTAVAPMHVTTSCGRQKGWDGQFGRDGAATTGAALLGSPQKTENKAR